ncbi:restriction endonuclease subunit S [Mesorhizobium sp. 131-2-1]|uniref:restriction endonuclease subunit S n=1 Tax=Mesorhizobium sp. 131-2-1 TaxID=2744518 RepID=UPI0019251A2D|nr:restriction endonuclease subunit S [Mesorhizobium sp. 131-2-1]BCG95987.1 restriction endonuclease S [Mesorhizobium sp. 131-2-1]
MSFPSYPRLKPSGVEWIGDLPDHWDVMPLKRIVSLRSGEMIRPDQVDETGTYPVYGGNGLRGYTSTYTHEGTYALVGRQGALCGNVNYASGQFWASEHAIVATPLCGMPVTWLGELLRTMNLGRYSTSAAQPGISVEMIANLVVGVPPLPEQTAIAAFLDRETGKIDTLVEEQKRLIELLKEKRQAVISHAVTKGLNPDVPMKASGVEWLGEVPEHWDVKPLKLAASVQTGTAKGKDNSGKDTVRVPYLRVANVQDGYLDLTDVAEIEIPASDLDRYRLRKGDVLMNEGGDFDKLGRGHVWYGEIDPCIHQNHVFAVRPREVSPEWLNAVTSSAYAQFYFMSRSKQSTNLASISSTNIMELPLVLPSRDEQVEILQQVDRQLSRLSQLSAECNLAVQILLERRASLISAAVTGKIDVRPFEDRSQADAAPAQTDRRVFA